MSVTNLGFHVSCAWESSAFRSSFKLLLPQALLDSKAKLITSTNRQQMNVDSFSTWIFLCSNFYFWKKCQREKLIYCSHVILMFVCFVKAQRLPSNFAGILRNERGEKCELFGQRLRRGSQTFLLFGGRKLKCFRSLRKFLARHLADATEMKFLIFYLWIFSCW